MLVVLGILAGLVSIAAPFVLVPEDAVKLVFVATSAF